MPCSILEDSKITWNRRWSAYMKNRGCDLACRDALFMGPGGLEGKVSMTSKYSKIFVSEDGQADFQQ